jgi:hypothetical protein
MRPVTDTISFPYTVPYDFDFCGMVDAPYAIPIEELNIKSVRERLYRGYSRTLPEIETTLSLFREKSEAIKKLVLSFELLPERERKEILSYLDGFYKMIESKSLVQKVFIDDARTN